MTIASGRDINLTATTDINIPADVGITFGDDGEKIEGDGTDLTIASGRDINLTATTDINIPADNTKNPNESLPTLTPISLATPW